MSVSSKLQPKLSTDYYIIYACKDYSIKIMCTACMHCASDSSSVSLAIHPYGDTLYNLHLSLGLAVEIHSIYCDIKMFVVTVG